MGNSWLAEDLERRAEQAVAAGRPERALRILEMTPPSSARPSRRRLRLGVDIVRLRSRLLGRVLWTLIGSA